MWKSVLLILLSIPCALVAFLITWLVFSLKTGSIVGLSIFGILNVMGIFNFFFVKKISAFEALIPIPISIIWSLILLPLSLGTNIFSAPAAIGSALLLSFCLYELKQDIMMNRGWILLPTLVFIYEMLPINIPGPIDDYLAFGSSSITTILSYLVTKKIEK